MLLGCGVIGWNERILEHYPKTYFPEITNGQVASAVAHAHDADPSPC